MTIEQGLRAGERRRMTASHTLRQATRTALGWLPQSVRHRLYRNMVRCDPAPDSRLKLKIAESLPELEGCFSLLHDAYVTSGFMKPDPSGMRVTIYHALPTTTTLVALWDGRPVGTLSLIRDGAFGLPMQSAFDLSSVRRKGGQIAEVSALAVADEFRRSGGTILFPLMKFMYEYCIKYFDTRHLVIAVNPNRIELYESLLFFERLPASTVNHYDFANGAPAVGATLDLSKALVRFKTVYGEKRPLRNLYSYFVETTLANIDLPPRPLHTTNDPVLTPGLMDHFFNRRTQVLSVLEPHDRALLRSIYRGTSLEAVLPSAGVKEVAMRRHPRYSIRCPARLSLGHDGKGGEELSTVLTDLSEAGCRVESPAQMEIGQSGMLEVELGPRCHSLLQVQVVRSVRAPAPVRRYALRVIHADDNWTECVHALESGLTFSDLLGGVPAGAAEACV
ncbi:MAG: GNAT family N-acetyltransferase [Burkholderiales bacterium]|nr:GNAT family N-acetyltransferase [Burkholderiales bacterium]